MALAKSFLRSDNELATLALMHRASEQALRVYGLTGVVDPARLGDSNANSQAELAAWEVKAKVRVLVSQLRGTYAQHDAFA